MLAVLAVKLMMLIVAINDSLFPFPERNLRLFTRRDSMSPASKQKSTPPVPGQCSVVARGR
jgi:hypothetical protein